MKNYVLEEMHDNDKNVFEVTFWVEADDGNENLVQDSTIYSAKQFEDDDIMNELIKLEQNFGGRRKLTGFNDREEYCPLYVPEGHTLVDIRVTHIDENGKAWRVEQVDKTNCNVNWNRF